MEENQKQIRIQRPNLKKYTYLVHGLLGANFIFTPSSVVIPRQVFSKVGLFIDIIRVGKDAALHECCIVSGNHPIFTELAVAIKRMYDKYHLTSANNHKARKKNPIERVNKLYPLLI